MSGRQTAPQSFESALAEFEALVEKMERGDLSLEDSVGAYERGVVLHRYCEEALSAAERKVRILADGSGEGSPDGALRAFEPERGSSGASNDGEPGSSAPPPAGRRPAARETREDDLPF